MQILRQRLARGPSCPVSVRAQIAYVPRPSACKGSFRSRWRSSWVLGLIRRRQRCLAWWRTSAPGGAPLPWCVAGFAAIGSIGLLSELPEGQLKRVLLSFCVVRLVGCWWLR